MAVSQIDRIEDELHRGYDGEPWHGPSLREVLQRVTAEIATARPVPNGHTIWEIVVHLAAWDDVVVRRIAESKAIETPEGGNYPPIAKPSPAAWDEALTELDRRHRRLRELVAQLEPARLDEVVPGKTYSVAVMLHGAAQHMAYHAGQIALLKKLTAATGS